MTLFRCDNGCSPSLVNQDSDHVVLYVPRALRRHHPTSTTSGTCAVAPTGDMSETVKYIAPPIRVKVVYMTSLRGFSSHR